MSRDETRYSGYLAEDVDWREIEVVTDRWGRPSLRLSGTIAHAVGRGLGGGIA